MANRKNRQVININDVNTNDLRRHFGKGRMATVVFTKKSDGSTRVLNGKTKVYRGLKGGDEAYNAEERGQLRVFDVNVRDKNTGERVGGYRAVTAQNVKEIRANGKIYKVVGGGEPTLAFVQGIQYSSAGTRAEGNAAGVNRVFEIGTLRLVLDGKVYRYFNVPREIHTGLVDAQNKGQYFGQNIRGKFNYTRVA